MNGVVHEYTFPTPPRFRNESEKSALLLAGSFVDMSNKDVPVTIISGFLGAGKSSLIRRILQEDHGHRIVVVENEFGDNVSIESAIIRQKAPDSFSKSNEASKRTTQKKSALSEIIELPNGCMCCSAQDELVKALAELVRLRRDSFDYILVETSGLADPEAVAAMFWVDEGLEENLKLDAVLTVVDCKNYKKYRNQEKTALLAEKQIAVSDVLLLNKTDLVQGDEVAKRVCRTNKNAVVIPCQYCKVDVNRILNINAYDCGKLLSTMSFHEDHIDSNIGTVTISFDSSQGVFDSTLLDRAFGKLIWGQESGSSQQIWRTKALVIVRKDQSNGAMIYQSVGELFDSEDASLAAEQSERQLSQFIFIGCNINKQHIASILKEALVS